MQIENKKTQSLARAIAMIALALFAIRAVLIASNVGPTYWDFKKIFNFACSMFGTGTMLALWIAYGAIAKGGCGYRVPIFLCLLMAAFARNWTLAAASVVMIAGSSWYGWHKMGGFGKVVRAIWFVPAVFAAISPARALLSGVVFRMGTAYLLVFLSNLLLAVLVLLLSLWAKGDPYEMEAAEKPLEQGFTIGFAVFVLVLLVVAILVVYFSWLEPEPYSTPWEILGMDEWDYMDFVRYANRHNIPIPPR